MIPMLDLPHTLSRNAEGLAGFIESQRLCPYSRPTFDNELTPAETLLANLARSSN